MVNNSLKKAKLQSANVENERCKGEATQKPKLEGHEQAFHLMSEVLQKGLQDMSRVAGKL